MSQGWTSYRRKFAKWSLRHVTCRLNAILSDNAVYIGTTGVRFTRYLTNDKRYRERVVSKDQAVLSDRDVICMRLLLLKRFSHRENMIFVQDSLCVNTTCFIHYYFPYFGSNRGFPPPPLSPVTVCNYERGDFEPFRVDLAYTVSHGNNVHGGCVHHCLQYFPAPV